MPSLFEPVQAGDLHLANRIAMAPLTRNRAPDAIPTPLMATYYTQRASAGLLITEATAISPQAQVLVGLTVLVYAVCASYFLPLPRYIVLVSVWLVAYGAALAINPKLNPIYFVIIAVFTVAVTGVAGPSGGSAHKPVGTVWFGFSVNGQLSSERQRFDGDRAEVRAQTVAHALRRLVQLLDAA